MVKRIARKGRASEQSFWVCPKYSRCRGTLLVVAASKSTQGRVAPKSKMTRSKTPRTVTPKVTNTIPTPPIRAVDPALRQLISTRVSQWVEQLMDLSRRNNLLFYRDTKNQTLELSGANPIEVDRVLAGESVSVHELFTLPDQTSPGLADALRRVKHIRSKARENFEERSLETLFLGIGEFSWTIAESIASSHRSIAEQRPPRAPVLLVPIELRVGRRKGDFNIQVVDEPEINPALSYIMKRDFGVNLVMPIAGSATEIQVPKDVLDAVIKQLDAVPGAMAKNTALVGNFSYAKLAMVQDLEGGIDEMTVHQLVLALADNQEALQSIRGNLTDPPLDRPNQVEPINEFLVLDADSSQNVVINAILEGQSFAFDGPPGTGKSQTIANAIACLVAEGKTVLFVAEKRAAIEAVMRRLKNVGLNDLVMDYHGTSKTKKDVIENLRQTDRALKVVAPLEPSSIQSSVKNERDRLVQHSEALHKMREPWGLSIYDALVVNSRHAEGADTKFRFPAATLDWFTEDFVKYIEERLRELWGLGGFTDSIGAELWRTADLANTDHALKLLDDLDDASSWKLSEIQTAFFALAESLGSNEDQLQSLRTLTKDSQDMVAFQQNWGMRLFAIELPQLLTDLFPARNIVTRSFARITKPSFRKAVKTVRSAVDNRPSARQALSATQDAMKLFATWTLTHQLATPIPDLTHSNALVEATKSDSLLRSMTTALTAFKPIVSTLQTSLSEARQLVDAVLRDRMLASGAYEAGLIEKQLTNYGVERLVAEARRDRASIEKMCDNLWYAWSQSLIERLGGQELGLNAHSSQAFQETATKFQKLDRDHIKSNPQRIRARWQRRAREAALMYQTEEAALINALNRKRGLPPLTQLFKQSKNCICSWKPCWVMSPLSVSMLRPPSQWFDVVIFDEASQILPADAITAIKAGKQLVVAGDDRQLPPTPFFASGQPDDDASDDTTIEFENEIRAGNYESILQMMKTVVTRPRQLQWHYRSRDEKLIAFSNHRIYKSLITFPDASSESCLRHELARSGPDAISKGATNKAEVAKVVELVVEHVHVRPEETLGIIALGVPHANAIDDALARERDNDSLLDDFMGEREVEPFFVKNLERVQGDERDAIILAVGYGRNDDQKIRYNFGPINGKNGDRRMNVATTRAKQRLTIVSTFTEMDLDKERCKEGGLAFLRDFIAYVRSNGENFGDTLVSTPAINAFEESIRVHLERAGLQLVPQYGVGKYRIDFAVKDPNDSNRLVLAVECDGASYHSYPTARERDRLRQEALEKRGWIFHRIWSTDWFRDPEGEVAKCVAAVKSQTHG